MSDLLSILGAAPANGGAKGAVRLSDIGTPKSETVFSNVFLALNEAVPPGLAPGLPAGTAGTGPLPGEEAAGDPAAGLPDGGDADALALAAESETDIATPGKPVAPNGADLAEAATAEGKTRPDLLAVAEARSGAGGDLASPVTGAEPGSRRAPAAQEVPAVLVRPPSVATSALPPAGTEDAALGGTGREAGRALTEEQMQQAALRTPDARVAAELRTAARVGAIAAHGSGATAPDPAAARSAFAGGTIQSSAQAFGAAQTTGEAGTPAQVALSGPPGATVGVQLAAQGQAGAAGLTQVPQPGQAPEGRSREARRSDDGPAPIRSAPAASGATAAATAALTAGGGAATGSPAANLSAAAQAAGLGGGEGQASLGGSDGSVASPVLQAADAPTRSFEQSLPPGQHTQTARPELARDIGRQMAASITAAADGSVDIALNPKELGHVRMSLSVTESGVILTVSGDRADTMDLMRRHADDLSAAFRDMGYENIAFSFGTGGSAGQPGDGNDQNSAPSGGSGGDPVALASDTGQPDTTARVTGDRGLDLRI